MTKDCSVGRDGEEGKTHSSMPVRLSDAHLYPEWEVVGEPYKDRAPGTGMVQDYVMIRKRIGIE